MTKLRRRLCLLVVAWAAAPPATVQAQPAPEVGVSYARGDPAAPLLVIELVDFACPACAHFATRTFPALDERFIRTGRVQWRSIPFVLGTFRRSAEAARAAACADEQSAFWPMHDLLFARRSAWLEARDANRTFRALAGDLGLDVDAFARCYDSDAAKERVERQTRAARRMFRVRGTPTFVVGEQVVVGALELPEFTRHIEAQLPR